MNPGAGGTVDATGGLNSMVVSFSDVPEFGGSGANNFSISLFADGAVELVFGSMTASDGLVGISAGGGVADPGSTDFSAASGPFDVSQTQYQLFNANFDLSGQTLRFESSVIPEPATLALFGLGLLGLGFSRRSK